MPFVFRTNSFVNILDFLVVYNRPFLDGRCDVPACWLLIIKPIDLVSVITADIWSVAHSLN